MLTTDESIIKTVRGLHPVLAWQHYGGAVVTSGLSWLKMSKDGKTVLRLQGTEQLVLFRGLLLSLLEFAIKNEAGHVCTAAQSGAYNKTERMIVIVDQGQPIIGLQVEESRELADWLSLALGCKSPSDINIQAGMRPARFQPEGERLGLSFEMLDDSQLVVRTVVLDCKEALALHKQLLKLAGRAETLQHAVFNCQPAPLNFYRTERIFYSLFISGAGTELTRQEMVELAAEIYLWASSQPDWDLERFLAS